MPRQSRENPEIREFILRNVRHHPLDIQSVVSKKFGLSRNSVAGYLTRLSKANLITASGNTSARAFKLKPLVEGSQDIRLTPGLSEDAVFRGQVLPHIKNLPDNIISICQYGFTEIFNNAVDHSGSWNAVIFFTVTYGDIEIIIIDRGVGIFQKIQRDFGFEDHRQALLELSKGKLTSDRKRHSGQGIFFTSRMFDEFAIGSANLFYKRTRIEADEWLIESKVLEKYTSGTTVCMTISTDADWTHKDIFEKYQSDPIGFRRTHVPIALGKYPGEQLVSRSQAKRILARFEEFAEVFLDFDSVAEIGPAFADEIFRVFQNEHPDIRIVITRANMDVQRTIDSVIGPADAEQLNLITR